MSKVLVMGTEIEYGVYQTLEQWRSVERFLDFSSLKRFGSAFITSSPAHWLASGGKFYIDTQDTPEYCTPECSSPLDLVRWEKAGDVLMRIIGSLDGANKQAITMVKHCRGRVRNAADCSEIFSGYHENYGLEISPYWWANILRGTSCLTTFLVSRLIISGAGYFGLFWSRSDQPFQISPRAAAITMLSGAGTTNNRGIINSRDEPHARLLDFRRLHLIVGDANMSEFSIFLTLGTTALVLRMMLESDLLADAPRLLNPVSALHQFSSDFNLQSQVLCHHGEAVTALQLQNYFWRKAVDFASAHLVTAVEERVIQEWGGVLEKLAQDPRLLKGVLDWPTVLCLIERLMETKGYRWEDFQKYKEGGLTARGSGEIKKLIAQCSALDLAYRNIAQNGLYYRLVKNNMFKRLLTDGQIMEAIQKSPPDTRARVRGEIVNWLPRHQTWGVLQFDWERVDICLTRKSLSDEAFFQSKSFFSLHDPLDSFCEEWQAFKKAHP